MFSSQTAQCASPSSSWPFEPRTIIWFHAVNTVDVWYDTEKRIREALARATKVETADAASSSVHAHCFGIECDVRYLSSPAEEVAAAPEDCCDCSDRLILAHEPLTTSFSGGESTFYSPLTCPLIFSEIGSQQTRGKHIGFKSLVDRLAKLAQELRSSSTTPKFTFILKIDVKDLSALPSMLKLLSAITTDTDGCKCCNGAEVSRIESASSCHNKLFEVLELTPCQVWLNMDVVPLAPTPLDGAVEAVAASSNSVATSALPYFQVAQRMGLGLSLGWMISPELREWLHGGGSRGEIRERLELSFTRGHVLMLDFITKVYSATSGSTTITTAGMRTTRLITFALYFGLFMDNEVTLGKLRELCDATEGVLSNSSAAAAPFIFPTYWRMRADSISNACKQQLILQCQTFVGRLCSVDQE